MEVLIAEYENETGKEFVLNENQLDVCKSIVDFINNTEYSACVEKSIQALYLLLRVEWMLYNGRPAFNWTRMAENLSKRE